MCKRAVCIGHRDDDLPDFSRALVFTEIIPQCGYFLSAGQAELLGVYMAWGDCDVVFDIEEA